MPPLTNVFSTRQRSKKSARSRNSSKRWMTTTLVHLLTQYPSTFSDTLPGLLAPDAWFIVRVNSRSHHQVEGFRWFRLEALVFRV